MGRITDIKELGKLPDREFIENVWEDGQKVLDVIDRQTTERMPMNQFLTHCTACGGNWGGMLLSGINELYPEVYEAIPDNMGPLAWSAICTVLRLLNIYTEEESKC